MNKKEHRHKQLAHQGVIHSFNSSSAYIYWVPCVAGTVLGPQDIKPDMIPG